MSRLALVRIEQILGRGGLCETLRAVVRDNKKERLVVVKRLLPTLVDDRAAVARLAEEARVLRALDHPRIPSFVGVGDDGGVPFFACALLPNARPLAAGVRVSSEETRMLAKDLAAALAHAHARGVVHRDVSRGNVLVDDDGAAFLIDFGIARAFGRARMTASDAVLGTPTAMSPEQAAGDDATAASDVFSAGVLLFSVLHGRHPLGIIDDDGVPARVHKARTNAPPPSGDPVIDACLQLDPRDRPRDGAALQALLTDAEDRAARRRLATRRVGVSAEETPESTL